MRILKWLLPIAFLSFAFVANAAQTKKEIPFYTEDKPALMVSNDQPQFILRLKSNPTTGYSWFLREYNGSLIEPVGHTFESSSNKKLMGAPSYEVWKFRVKPGSFIVPQVTMIRFVYARPWEAEDGSTQLVFKVSIEQADKK